MEFMQFYLESNPFFKEKKKQFGEKTLHEFLRNVEYEFIENGENVINIGKQASLLI